MAQFTAVLTSLLLCLSVQVSLSQEYPDEILFHSNGSTFAPLVTIQGEAEILWTFEDNTTSTSANPAKDYGTAQLRVNRLKVTPWSALIAINIGYDGSDGGSSSIPHVSDQRVSDVEHLGLAAPSLVTWCSSYNMLDSLNFDNFVNLETVECFRSLGVRNVSLRNTPSLKRLCLEDNDLRGLDVSDCTGLIDFRAALNAYTDVIFSNSTEEMWHICIRDNPSITNPAMFADMSKFPAISDLLIWNTRQSGTFAMHASEASYMLFQAGDNAYTVLDLSGALQLAGGWGGVEFNDNKIASVNVAGCVQLARLILNNNCLLSDSVDRILQQLDELGTSNRTVELLGNSAPTAAGLAHKANLEARGWTVRVQTGPKITMTGNGNAINDGDTMPSASNSTDYGSVNVALGMESRTFTIRNTGADTLVLGGTPNVVVSGAHAADFAVTSQPARTALAPGDTTSFTVQFDPSETGLRSAAISIVNNDSVDNPFDFIVQGTGSAAIVTFMDGTGFTPGITPGVNNQALGRFRLKGDLTGASLTGASIVINGIRSGLANLKLWSSVDGSFDPGLDTQIGSTVATDPGDGAVVSFSGCSSEIGTEGIYYFLTGDVAAGATGAAQAIIEQNSALTIEGGVLAGTIDRALLSGSDPVLPVELVSFTASCAGSDVILVWRTVSESKCAGFEVERRFIGGELPADGAGGNPEAQSEWTMVGSIAGSGTSQTPRDYRFVDRASAGGRYLFRLKQLDHDGAFQYSHEVEVVVAVARTLMLARNYPNPFNPSTQMRFTVPSNGEATLTIYNAIGQEVALLFDGIAESGRYYHVEFNGTPLPSGIYYARLQFGGNQQVNRIVLLK